MQTGFDNDWYATMQAEQIRMRIGEFGGKLLGTVNNLSQIR